MKGEGLAACASLTGRESSTRPSVEKAKQGWRDRGSKATPELTPLLPPSCSLNPSSEYLGYLQACLLAHVLAELVHGGGDHLLSFLKNLLALVAGPQQLLVVHQVDSAPSHTALDEEPAGRERNHSSSADSAGHLPGLGPRVWG